MNLPSHSKCLGLTTYHKENKVSRTNLPKDLYEKDQVLHRRPTVTT